MADSPSRPAGIRASASYSPALDSLRGWAIGLVFLFHADGVVTGFERIGTWVSPATAFMTAGHTGVTLFFILSAFLLSRPFLEEGLGGPIVKRILFYQRRVLRIMPLYAVAIAVSVWFNSNQPTALTDGLSALFFLNSFTGSVGSLMPFSAVWWSLATEIQFYLLLPLLGLSLRSKTGRRIGLAALLLWMAAYVGLASQHGLVSNGTIYRLNLSIFGRAPAFLCGIAAAWIVYRHGDRIRDSANRMTWLRYGGADAFLLTTLFGLGIVLQRITNMGFIRTEVTSPSSLVATSILWTLVLLLVLLAPLRLRSLISNRLTSALGLVSYSVYLIHEPIIFFGLVPLTNRGIPIDVDLPLRAAAFAIAFSICIALSAVAYFLIERPFLIRKSKIGIK